LLYGIPDTEKLFSTEMYCELGLMDWQAINFGGKPCGKKDISYVREKELLDEWWNC